MTSNIHQSSSASEQPSSPLDMETMNWYLAAPFIHDASDLWLTKFVPNNGRLRFHAVPASYQHDRSRKVTGLAAWADYFGHGSAVWNAAQHNPQRSGILTCFPQLPIAVGLRKRLARSDIPIVAWNMNLGSLYPGARQRLAKVALRDVDRFVVHSRLEVAAYSEWLEMDPKRFEFVPLQRATLDITVDEDREEPFVLSMGSAHRDYRLLFAVLAELRFPAVVVAGQHAIEGLKVPANVTVRRGLTVEQCHLLVQRARVNVIPVDNQHTASGQVTLLDAMVFGRATVMTRCPACVDYVEDGRDTMLVSPGDHEALKAAVAALWDDDVLRATMGAAARRTAIARFSDPAIGKEMGRVLVEVAAQRA